MFNGNTSCFKCHFLSNALKTFKQTFKFISTWEGNFLHYLENSMYIREQCFILHPRQAESPPSSMQDNMASLLVWTTFFGERRRKPIYQQKTPFWDVNSNFWCGNPQWVCPSIVPRWEIRRCIKGAPWLRISFHQAFPAADREKHNCGSVLQAGNNHTLNHRVIKVGKDFLRSLNSNISPAQAHH